MEAFASSEHIVIGWVGRMERVKAPALLLEAFLALAARRPEWRTRLRLLLAGDGSQRAALEARVREAGADDRVWFAGARDDVPAILRGLDLFALPSLAEGISNTVLEAMASGLPVVATRVGGNAELVAEGETGLLVPAGDEAALCTALETLCTDAERRQAMGRAARTHVEQCFSLHTMAARYAGVYDTLLERA